MPVSRVSVLLCALLTMSLLPVQALQAADHGGNRPAGSASNWSFPLRGGYVYQFDADLDQGGSFSINRLYLQGGPVYSLGQRRSFGLSIGYGYDTYDFSGLTAGQQAPWEDIHSWRISTPVRWGIGSDWTMFVFPTLRFTAENGADWGDALTGGGFAGFSYRLNDHLTIGPGIGILTELEDDATTFPILLIDWKITDRLSLETGAGLAATRGPGLLLNYRTTDSLELFVGGRYEKQRFRLADDGPVPDGIGESSSFPVFVGANYSCSDKTKASLVGGAELGGELRREDLQGRLVSQDDYDPALFLGAAFSGRF